MKIPISPSGILSGLKRIAPNVCFSTSWTEDPNFRWDGDGPDPAEEGYMAYDVDVRAVAIVRGEFREGNASLGGSYSKPGEHDKDIHGYLPQMLAEAAADLSRQVRGTIHRQAQASRGFLEKVLRLRYARSMS